MSFAPPVAEVHVVLRGSGFEADGLQRERGEVLDTSEWKRSPRPLVESRRLAAVFEPFDSFTTCNCGRRWVDEESMAAHRCPAVTTTRRKAN